jgi:hypothetical protein
MRQQLTTDTVSRYIEASPEALYDIVSDVRRTPEMSPEVVRCTWLDGATGPAVGARFKAVNSAGRGPNWPNRPVVVTAEPGREFAFARTEIGGGTVEWRYRFVPEGTGTRVEESYLVTRPVNMLGWFIIDTLYGLKDRQGDLRRGMQSTLERLAALAEPAGRPA